MSRAASLDIKLAQLLPGIPESAIAIADDFRQFLTNLCHVFAFFGVCPRSRRSICSSSAGNPRVHIGDISFVDAAYHRTIVERNSDRAQTPSYECLHVIPNFTRLIFPYATGFSHDDRPHSRLLSMHKAACEHERFVNIVKRSKSH
jgi:hypothetical protein